MYNKGSMRFYTAQDVADMLKVHRRTVTRWIAKGELVGLRSVGKGYRISEEDLRKFLEKRRTNRVE